MGGVDALVECSAEPSALAGFDGSPGFLVGANLIGAYNCLEVAARNRPQLIFLSASRVYALCCFGADHGAERHRSSSLANSR